MAKVGAQYLVAAPLTETQGAPSYQDGFVVGRAITVNITPNESSASLYADNKMIEFETQFLNCALALTTDDLSYETQAGLLGHTVATASEGQTMKANSNDLHPYVGFGAIFNVRRDGLQWYRAIWLYKVRFQEPTDENATKGESITFGTPSINGQTVTLDNGDWKDELLATTFEQAKTWLDAYADISEE